MTYIQSDHEHARMWKMIELYHLCAPTRIHLQVSHVTPMLVVPTLSYFQSTTARSTIWTARRDLLEDNTVHRQPLPQEPLQPLPEQFLHEPSPANNNDSWRNFGWARGRHSQNCGRLPWRFRENSDFFDSWFRSQQVFHFSVSSAEEASCLQLESWTSTRHRSCIEKQIAGHWHLITLQEACDYVDHAILHERFYVTHFAGCAVFFNKDTFYTNVDVKSIYLHDTRRVLHDHIVEGEHGWVLQGVVSRASFRRAAANGQTVFTVLSLHINNVNAKKRGIAKKIIQAVRSLANSQDIDLVAGNFNGAALRCRSRDNLSSIDEAFADCALLTPPGFPPLWCPRSIPNNWADVCGFLKLLVLSASGRWRSMVLTLYFTRQWSKLPSWDVASFALRWLE